MAGGVCQAGQKFAQQYRETSLTGCAFLLVAYVNELKENRQYGTTASYVTACNALHKFKSSLKLEDITKEFLQKFENWMVGNDYSITTVGIYVRTLRAIINLAKDSGMIKPELYPFGRRKYVIPTGKKCKEIFK